MPANVVKSIKCKTVDGINWLKFTVVPEASNWYLCKKKDYELDSAYNCRLL
jgi:hypothetical protein